jgi:hypothetical protein
MTQDDLLYPLSHFKQTKFRFGINIKEIHGIFNGILFILFAQFIVTILYYMVTDENIAA